MTASSRAPRPTPHRSLPSITIFSHPAARLIKAVPQLQPPNRVNAHVPRDTLGVGRTSFTDLVLTDIYGPLSLLVVPDPLDPTIATLVISVDIQDVNLQGAARRFVLPFRSFQRDPVNGELVSRSKINDFDAADRVIYPGLGAGLKGLDGGSFWFVEDVGEQGALDRFRWEKDNVGRRAIWTLWLISTPAPVVLHVQQLLQTYPAPVAPLPPWLKQRNGYPWQDSYLQHTLAPPAAAPDTSAALDETLSSPSSASQQPLPSLSHIPSEPQHLRAKSAQSSRPELTALQLADTVPVEPETSQEVAASSSQSPLGYTDSQIEPSLAGINPASNLSVRSKHLRDGSSSLTIGDTPQVILRDPSRTAAISEYRNSLVAVDNLTGQIIGVLASHVDLDTSPAASSTDLKPVASSSSQDEADVDADEQHEAQTPLDEYGHKSSDLALGLGIEPKLLPELPTVPDSINDDSDLPTPRATKIIHRPATVYHDADAQRPSSRPPSILAAETFSPPPLPPKKQTHLEARPVAKPTLDDASSRRISTASVAFLTADSDIDTISSYDSDAFEIDARTITHDHLPRSTSIRARAGPCNLETHRPELLHDPPTHDDADSDASGSTIGGPAVRLWRKARGKPKKKPLASANSAAKSANQSRPPRQPSELSDRTSKAETALEAFSDDEAVREGGQDAQVMSAGVSSPARSDREPLPKTDTRPGYHLARTELRTDQVRSIEDRIWREALDADQLPIDAPYTHLAARGDAGYYPSSILSSPPQSIADGSAIELLSVEDKTRQVQRAKAKQQQQNQRAERIKQMQGGTVLIEFLAGSSRIGANLIRTAGLDTASNAADVSAREADAESSSKAIDLASNVLGYVPLLPQHLLSFFGLSSPSAQSGAAVDPATSSPQLSTAFSPTSYLPDLRLPSVTNWVSNLFSFSFNSFASAGPSVADVEEAGDPSRAEEWEYVIPEFDPNSLSSTPRPIYRRKRPVPSFTNGFNISASAASSATTEAETKKDVIAAVEVKPNAAVPSAGANQNRYSVVHFDSLGVGRRAFLRGMPGVNGACF